MALKRKKVDEKAEVAETSPEPTLSKTQAPDPVRPHGHVINKLTGSCKICGRSPE